MRRGGLLQSELLRVLAALGHGEQLVIADAGLPIPRGVPCIDLAVRPGLPPLLPVVETVLEELVVERAILAEELKHQTTEVRQRLPQFLSTRGIPFSYVPHTEFKRMSADARAIVRTGEFSPFANVLLVAGVAFS